MLNIIFWIVFGTLVGWIAAILQEKAHPLRHTLSLAIIGAIGGLSGGLFSLTLSPSNTAQDPQADGLLFAVIGAIALILLATYAANRRPSD